MDVTDEQWAVLEPLIPEEERHPRGRGRPWCPARDVFNSMYGSSRTTGASSSGTSSTPSIFAGSSSSAACSYSFVVVYETGSSNACASNGHSAIRR